MNHNIKAFVGFPISHQFPRNLINVVNINNKTSHRAPYSYLKSFSTEGVDNIEQALRGLRCFSGLGNKSLISTVEDTLGFWHRESKLREADEARRLLSALREENEFSDIVELLRL